MKKITKKDLKGLNQLFPILGKEEMRYYVGGYSGSYWGGNGHDSYSYFDYGRYGDYDGYYYDGSGYRLPEVTIYGYYPYYNQGGGNFWPIFPNGPLDNPNAGYPYFNGQQDYNENPAINGYSGINGYPSYDYYGYGYYGSTYCEGGSGSNENSDDGNKRGDIIKSDWACMFNCMNFINSSKSAEEYYKLFIEQYEDVDPIKDGGLTEANRIRALKACGFSFEEASTVFYEGGSGIIQLVVFDMDDSQGRTHAGIVTGKTKDGYTIIYDPTTQASYETNFARIATVYRVKKE